MSTKTSQAATPAGSVSGTAASSPSSNHHHNHHHHPTKSLHHVNFNPETDTKITEKKKRYLTAKYGQHQMNLIKKRLKVEMWMYEQLQFLFDSDDNFNDIEIDLDEVLDLEGKTRKQWLREKLIDAKKSKDVVEKFIVELLEKANTL